MVSFFNILSKGDHERFIHGQKFAIFDVKQHDPEFSVVVNGKLKRYRFTDPDHFWVADRVRAYFARSKGSVPATLKQLDKYAKFARDVPLNRAELRASMRGRFVACSKCGAETQEDGHPPGSRCPVCDDGEMEKV